MSQYQTIKGILKLNPWNICDMSFFKELFLQNPNFTCGMCDFRDYPRLFLELYRYFWK